MEKEKVTLTICGSDYCITTTDEPEYVESLGKQLDEDISALFDENSRLSVTQAAILAALNYADEAKKASETAENLRSQIKEFLEDSQRYKMEAEVARHDVNRLKKELEGKGTRKPF